MMRIRSQLVSVNSPIVMGILNVTPDSFAVHCNSMDEAGVLDECDRLVGEGADWVDVGACSTRPHGQIVMQEEEIHRLDMALCAIRKKYPNLILSVDTFRADVAEHVINNYGVDIINDVSGMRDERMVQIVSQSRVPYIYTYSQAVSETMLCQIALQADTLHRAGVSDVIVDPGVGFGKTMQDNYRCLHQIGLLKHIGCDVMVGLSRKSMIYNLLGITPQQALTATAAAHMLALVNGANILRVHDVKETKQIIEIWKSYCL